MKEKSNNVQELAGEVQHVLIIGNQIIILGSCDDSNDEGHNCDQMGCTSTMCTLLKGTVVELGASTKDFKP